VGEKLEIRKNIIEGRRGPSDTRLCVVTGIHGDELEGQYVCFELARRLNLATEHLAGRVEIYPALNPLGVDSITRGFPTFDLDMNRIFPGAVNGHLIENTAYNIIQDLKGADMTLDIHSSNIFLREVPQVRINVQTADVLLPWAKLLNTDFIWIHEASTVLQSTLAHSLNALGTRTLVVEMGIAMRITRAYGDRLVDGIFKLMNKLGMWDGPCPQTISEPIVSRGDEVVFMNADCSGIIIPEASHSAWVQTGQRLCQIVEPFDGKVLQDVLSPVDGFLFTMRTFPIVYEGSLIARIHRQNGGST
jgi:predicted deacylase